MDIPLFIPLRHPPCGLFILFQFVETFFLFFFVNIQQKLDDQVPVLGQLFFERVDGVECSGQILVFRPFFKSVDKDSAVPAPVIDRDPASGRRLCPETPHERMHPFLFRLIFDRMHLKSPGIHALDQASDLEPFSRCAESFKNDHDRDPQCFAFSLETSKLGFQMRHFFLILFL